MDGKVQKKRKGRCERTEREGERGGHERVEPKPITILSVLRLPGTYGSEYTMIHYTLFLRHSGASFTYRLR